MKMHNTVTQCRCGNEFRQMNGQHFKLCLDCRMQLSEDATHGRDVAEYMSRGGGYRLVRGFNMIAKGYDRD